MLRSISDLKIRQTIIQRINSLDDEPEKIGKPLGKDLSGFRSVRTVGQRYRIVYRVQRSKSIVSILAVGIRKDGDKNDIYNIARKLARIKHD